MAYYTPTSSTWCGSYTNSVGDYMPVNYHVWLTTSTDKLDEVTATAKSLSGFLRIQFDGYRNEWERLVDIIVCNQKDVEWLILKYPGAKYKVLHVA